jgi:NDP-sugar pyrophosphorylase family protein
MEDFMLGPQDLFDLSDFAHANIFNGCKYAWEAIAKIEEYITNKFSSNLKPELKTDFGEGVTIKGDVYVGKGTTIEPGAFIQGPTIIGDNCQIRQGAYIRGNILIGDKCIIGHATEAKNAIFLNEAQASHFAYVGDSILGKNVNLGAGTRLANVPLFSLKDPVTLKRSNIFIKINGDEIDTGLGKLGAIIGDDVHTGCNVVTSPGCIIGPRSRIYALLSLGKGYHSAESVVKLRQQIEQTTHR